MSNEFPALTRYQEWIQGRTISGLFLRRSEAWLAAATASLHQPTNVAKICTDWSNTCDQLLVETAKQYLLQQLSVFAVGKLGASELNLSSDIDLIFVSDHDPNLVLPEIRKWLKAIQLQGQQGAYRVDLDLRPGGRYSSILCTTSEFEDYYGNYGEAWERLALLRLRPIFGETSVIERILKFRDRFCYRKYLDLHLIEAFKDIRSKIHQQYGARSSNDVIDLKLGLGGIRDIELYTHSLQVIHGGKNQKLRTRHTEEALRLLSQEKILPKTESDFLIEHYWNLRSWENLVQAQEDRQTHLLKKGQFSFLSEAIWNQLQIDCQRASQTVASFFGEVNLNERLLPATLEAQEQWLTQLGFCFSEIQEAWAEMLKKDSEQQHRLIYLFLTELANSSTESSAFLRFRDFLKSIKAKSSFFILLLRHEKLLRTLANVFAFSPYLSQILISRPEILDSFIYRADEPVSSTDLESILSHWADRKQLTELTLGTDFLMTQDLERVQETMTTLADHLGQDLLSRLNQEHGTQLRILAMGKWGRQQLGFRSDLDFVFVTGEEPTQQDAKVARRWISWISENHPWGRLYAIDHRLNPKESRQTLVTSETNLVDYLKKAPRWMHQAYLSARFIDGSSSNEIRRKCMIPISSTEMKELERIRLELTENARSPWDIKYSPGGLLDIELCLQTLEIQSEKLDASELIKNYFWLRNLEQLYQLLASSSGSEISPKSEAFSKISRLLRIDCSGLEAELQKTLLQNLKLLNILDPRRRSS